MLGRARDGSVAIQDLPFAVMLSFLGDTARMGRSIAMLSCPVRYIGLDDFRIGPYREVKFDLTLALLG